MRKLCFGFGLLFYVSGMYGQMADTVKKSNVGQNAIYSFIIQDSPARLFTMRQIDQDYLSGYQLYSRMMEKNFSPLLNYTIQTVTSFFALGPLTHEEGHRSILISKNIGSISQPFFLSRRGGYIDGVTDSTLKHMRDRDFPDYTRLYTAGLESDYMLTHRAETLLAFEDETYKNLVVEYLFRKIMILQYNLMGFVKFDIDGDEEKDELKRDIVGNDVYGVIRHLHRPAMPFHRYTRYSDLTSQEVKYLHTMGYRSLLNLVNLNIIGIRNVSVSDYIKMNFGMGHIICPFGDFIDENIWLKYKEKLKIDAYFRQFQNNSKWFMGGGIGINNYSVASKFNASVHYHWWNQPAHFGFNDIEAKFGQAIDLMGHYFFLSNQKTRLKALSVDVGIIYKTKGYLPEEVYMGHHFGIRLGTSFALDN